MSDILTTKEIDALLGDPHLDPLFYTKRDYITDEQKINPQYLLSQNQIDILREEYKENTRNLTVLLVDDAAFMRMMQRDIFNKNGYRVIGEACDIESALEKFTSLSPNIVVIDLNLENSLDGLELIKEIKKTNNQTYILVCSAEGSYNIVKQCFELGANDYIIKPFEPNRLCSIQL